MEDFLSKEKVNCFLLKDQNDSPLAILFRFKKNNYLNLITPKEVYNIYFYYNEIIIHNSKLSSIKRLNNSYKNTLINLLNEILGTDFLNIAPARNSSFINLENKNYYVSKYGVVEYDPKPLKIDFMFPNLTRMISNRSKESIFTLRNVHIPPTLILQDNIKINDVLWVISLGKEKYTYKYPFNTSTYVCTNLNYILRTGGVVTPYHWYSEPPSDELVVILPRYLPVILYALKNNSHDLIPLAYTKSYGKKIKLSYNITIYPKGEEKRNLKLENDDIFLPSSIYRYISNKYGDKIMLEDEMEVDYLNV